MEVELKIALFWSAKIVIVVYGYVIAANLIKVD